MVTFIAENIAAMNAGEAIPHFYTAGAVSSFFGFTGCGISIGCVVACMLSKSKRYRKIGKISLFPALFGINRADSVRGTDYSESDYVHPARLWWRHYRYPANVLHALGLDR